MHLCCLGNSWLHSEAFGDIVAAAVFVKLSRQGEETACSSDSRSYLLISSHLISMLALFLTPTSPSYLLLSSHPISTLTLFLTPTSPSPSYILISSQCSHCSWLPPHPHTFSSHRSHCSGLPPHPLTFSSQCSHCSWLPPHPHPHPLTFLSHLNTCSVPDSHLTLLPSHLISRPFLTPTSPSHLISRLFLTATRSLGSTTLAALCWMTSLSSSPPEVLEKAQRSKTSCYKRPGGSWSRAPEINRPFGTVPTYLLVISRLICVLSTKLPKMCQINTITKTHYSSVQLH